MLKECTGFTVRVYRNGVDEKGTERSESLYEQTVEVIDLWGVIQSANQAERIEEQIAHQNLKIQGMAETATRMREADNVSD
jgi:hypothetical protein